MSIMVNRSSLNIASVRVLTRGWVVALFVAATLTVLSSPVKADMLLFWNFDGYSTEDGTNYVMDSVQSERLNLVSSSISNGKLTATSGYAQGTVEGTNGVNVTLPTGSSNYTLSAFLSTTTSGAVGIIAWGTNVDYSCNSFRTDKAGLKSYWWNADLSVTGYPEVISGFENHVVTTGVGTTHNLYLNGQLIGTNSTHARDELNQNFTVGNTVNSEKLNGTIDNASVYNDAMAHTDIINISSSRYNGLTNLWKSGKDIDIVSGASRPDTVSGTTVITGTSGDVMVFNRTLETGEQAYYQGQLASDHAYVVDNMAGSESGKTTWVQGTSANLSDAAQTPLGIYVGGTTSKPTLTATAQQLNAVNRTLLLGNGTLAISSSAPFSLDNNKVDFDGGNVSITASSNVTFNSDNLVSVRNISSAAGSVLQFNATDEIRVLGALSGTGTVVFSGDSTTTLLSQSSSFTGTMVVQNGNELVFRTQDEFNNAHNNSNVKVVVDGGRITNSGQIYEYLTTVTLKNGAQIYASDGNTIWEAFKIRDLNVLRSADGAAATTTISAVANNDHAAFSFAPQSNQVGKVVSTIYVEDITSASADSHDTVSDLVISAKIVNPTTDKSGPKKVAGHIVKTGSGTLELNNLNSSFSGNLTVDEGTLKISAGSSDDNRTASALGASNVARTITINSGAVLELAAQDIICDAHADSKIAFVIDGGQMKNTGAFYNFIHNVTLKNGANLHATNGVNKWEAYKIQTLNVVRNSDGSAATAPTLTAGSGTHTVFTFGTISSKITTTPATIYVEDITSANGASDNVTDLLISGKIVNPAGSNGSKTTSEIDKTGAGTLELTATNSYSGKTKIVAGKIKLTGAGTLGTGAVENNALLELAYNSDMTCSNAISGTGDLIKTGTGTLTLSSSNSSFTGDIYLNEGKITVSVQRNGSNSVFGAVQAGRNIYVNSGTELIFNNQDIFNDAHHDEPVAIVVNGGKISNGAYYNYLQHVTLKDGGNLHAVNGNTAWEAYKLQYVDVLRNDDNSAAHATTITSSGSEHAVITFGSITSTISDVSSTIYVQDITSASADSVDNLSDLVISAKIVDPTISRSGTVGNKTASKIIKSGAGTLEFSNVNTYTGKTTVSEGTLYLSTENAIALSSSIVNNAAITANSNQTLNNLSGEDGTGTINIAGNLTLNNDQMTKFIGSITATAIEKTGDGTLKIYTGAEGKVDSHSLVVSSGRLDLKGYLTGTITVDDAVFSPGNSIGEATFGGGFILNDAGSELLMEIGGENPDQNDALIAGGDLTLNDGLIYLTKSSDSTFNHGDTFIAVLSGDNSGDAGFGDDLLSHVQSYYFTDFEYIQLNDS